MKYPRPFAQFSVFFLFCVLSVRVFHEVKFIVSREKCDLMLALTSVSERDVGRLTSSRCERLPRGRHVGVQTPSESRWGRSTAGPAVGARGVLAASQAEDRSVTPEVREGKVAPGDEATDHPTRCGLRVGHEARGGG